MGGLERGLGVGGIGCGLGSRGCRDPLLLLLLEMIWLGICIRSSGLGFLLPWSAGGADNEGEDLEAME